MEEPGAAVERAQSAGEPVIEFIRRAMPPGARLGVLPSSFNPVTVAHVELIRRAVEQFGLDESLVLAGCANADKSRYECPLEERLAMLERAFRGQPRVSVGLSSHAFFIDMLEAIERAYPPGTEIFFVVGFDTLERILDREGRYTARYHRRFADRRAALDALLSGCRLIVAGRGAARAAEVRRFIEREMPEYLGRVLPLDWPADLGEQSATRVRERLREGRDIKGLVPPAVEAYIRESGLYGRGAP